MDQPPYSSDLALSDFQLFRYLKEFLGDQRFNDDEQIKILHRRQISLTSEFKKLLSGMTNLNYVEKLKVCRISIFLIDIYSISLEEKGPYLNKYNSYYYYSYI